MTINEFIYQVLDAVNISTDDFPMSKRFIYACGKSARSELIKQELNKNILLDNGSLQTIVKVKMERTETTELSGIYVLRSDIKIPKVIEYKRGPAVFVYMMNGKQVSIVQKEVIHGRKDRRFPMIGFYGGYLQNDYLFIAGYDDVDEIDVSVDGHFTDPEEIIALNLQNDENCEDKCISITEYDFICPAHIERRVIELAASIALRKLQIPEDKSNNSQFDPNVKSSQNASSQ
jgi:hypothetical protein